MKKILFVTLLILSGYVYSSSYECVVTRKLDSENIYPQSQLDQYKHSVRIKDEKTPELERCSFTPSEKKITCERYKVDRVEVDKNVGIKKFYNFISQFDVQLYTDMRFVENNGRGGISYGKCEKL